MYFGPNAKIALFIDGQFLYSASRNLGFDVDYRNLLELFRKQGVVVRAYYYVAMLDNEEYSPLRPLTDWLAYNGYTLISKTAREHTDGEGRRRVKANMEVEIVCDMFTMAPRVSHLVVVSGNGDLVQAVRRLQEQQGVNVTVVSSMKTSPPMVADELRRQVDEFVELAEIAPEFTRRQREPREPRERTAPAPAVSLTPADPFGEALPRRRTATG